MLAAAFAFGAALLPHERALAERARGAVGESLQAAALERIAQLAREAWSAGPGTRLEAEVGLPADQTRLNYREGVLEAEGRLRERGFRLARTSPPLRLGALEARRGRYRVEVLNEGEAVRVTLRPTGGRGRASPPG